MASNGPASSSAATKRALGLRERKKRRSRSAMTEAALELFWDAGYEKTTLEQLVDRAEVSMRTFFRYFDSKVAVALAVEQELWDGLVERTTEISLKGPVIAVLRRALLDTIVGMDDDWERRFIRTRGLAARTPELLDTSSLNTLVVQRRLVETLEKRTGVDGRVDVRLRLVCDLAMSAWRSGAQNWVRRGRNGRADPAPEPRETLVALIEEAFDALPASLELTFDGFTGQRGDGQPTERGVDEQSLGAE